MLRHAPSLSLARSMPNEHAPQSLALAPPRVRKGNARRQGRGGRQTGRRLQAPPAPRSRPHPHAPRAPITPPRPAITGRQAPGQQPGRARAWGEVEGGDRKLPLRGRRPSKSTHPVGVHDVRNDDQLARLGAVVDQGDAADLDVAGEGHGDGVFAGGRASKEGRGEKKLELCSLSLTPSLFASGLHTHRHTLTPLSRLQIDRITQPRVQPRLELSDTRSHLITLGLGRRRVRPRGRQRRLRARLRFVRGAVV